MAEAKLYPSVYEEVLVYLAEHATPQQVLAFQVSETSQQRADYLTEHNKAGTLTPEESFELEQMLEVDRMIGVLKAKALLALKDS